MPCCDACGRPAGEGRWCQPCAVTAVTSPEQAQRLIHRVLRWAEGLGIVLDPAFVLRVTLTDRPSDRPGHLGSTLIRHLVSSRGERRRVLGMSLRRGLPAHLFMGVVAHELAHVWTAIRRWRLHPWAEEGLGELVAYRFYHDLGTPEALFLARRIEINPDPLYGDGFRRMRCLVGAGKEELRRFLRER
jgi:hypothetical protein